MGFITYKQADSRWGKKNYNGSSTMAEGGCGPTSCAMIAYGVDGKTTPIDTMKYMQTHGDSTHKTFALYGQGTAWNGITQCLKAFGLKDVQVVYSMDKCFELMAKGYVGVFRFQPGSRGGVTWTTAGHYIAVTNYKEKNGKHYIYTRDSGGRNHTGWYCYETTMKGLLSDPAIWLGRIGEETTTEEKTETKKLCIDTSYWQGKHSVADWKKVAKKCDFVLHRASYTSLDSFSLHDDSTFDTNFKNAKEAGLKCGAYHYSQALTVAEAKKEAKYLCNRLKGLDVDFYVCCDYEFGKRLSSKIGTKASKIANAFCKVVKANGYTPLIYGNLQMMNGYLTKPKYPVWIAQYNSSCSYKKDYVMWQYTSSGSVDGISGRVDLSKVYDIDSFGTTETVETSSETVETSSKYTGTLPDLTLHARQMIGHTARNLAYAKNTTKATYTYPKGKAKEAFKKAINKVYPNRSGWSAQCRAGASCDVGAGTCIRFSGYDTAIPRGLAEQIPHLKKSKLWKKTSIKKGADMKYGDVGVYSGNGGHIWISLGGKLLCEANHTAKYFEHVVSKNIGKGNHTYFAVFRACKPMNIGYGDEGTEVTKLQKFLKWYGYDITPTGKYGDVTKKCVLAFKAEKGLGDSPEIGSKTLKAMKEAKK